MQLGFVCIKYNIYYSSMSNTRIVFYLIVSTLGIIIWILSLKGVHHMSNVFVWIFYDRKSKDVDIPISWKCTVLYEGEKLAANLRCTNQNGSLLLNVLTIWIQMSIPFHLSPISIIFNHTRVQSALKSLRCLSFLKSPGR